MEGPISFKAFDVGTVLVGMLCIILPIWLTIVIGRYYDRKYLGAPRSRKMRVALFGLFLVILSAAILFANILHGNLLGN